MTVIGLTGKTGSGKSAVCAQLKKQGVYIIDTDIIARKVVEKDMPALKELCDRFGEDILNDDKTLNRKALAKKAFSSKENTEILNEITHPHIVSQVKKELDFAKENGYDYCIIDAAALFESDCKDFCDFVAVVSAREKTRLKRILSRDSLTKEDALRRMHAQKDDKYYLKRADIIIVNDADSDVESSAKQLLKFIKENR